MRYTVLGQVAAWDGERPVRVGGPQQRRLLAMLLAHRGQFLSSERLVDVLWPDGLASPGAGRSIHTYVSRLRAALGADSILTRDTAYALGPAFALIDADEFAHRVDEASTLDLSLIHI